LTKTKNIYMSSNKINNMANRNQCLDCRYYRLPFCSLEYLARDHTGLDKCPYFDPLNALSVKEDKENEC